MGCNTSKESVHPTTEAKEDNNDNRDKDSKGESNNTEKKGHTDADETKDTHVTVNNIEEKDGAREVKEGKSEEKSSSAKTVILKPEEIKTESLQIVETKAKGEPEVNGQDESETDLEDAAVKIQAAFRGHQTRKTMKQADKPNVSTAEPEPSQEQLEAEFRADDKELCNAATKIQASFRGHMVRKHKEKEDDEKTEDEIKQGNNEEEELDIDLTDPDLNKAAIKIQASFRGHLVRKENDE